MSCEKATKIHRRASAGAQGDLFVKNHGANERQAFGPKLRCYDGDSHVLLGGLAPSGYGVTCHLLKAAEME